jgi:hypothetical protein
VAPPATQFRGLPQRCNELDENLRVALEVGAPHAKTSGHGIILLDGFVAALRELRVTVEAMANELALHTAHGTGLVHGPPATGFIRIHR